MRKEWLILLGCCGVSLFSCAGTSDPTAQPATALDGKLEQATVEDYILAQPDAYVGEKSPAAFRTRVLAARALPQNTGRDADSLYIPAEETLPAKSFQVNRKRHSLVWQVIDRSSDKPAKRYERIRYKSKWWDLNSPMGPW
ncbi:MAG: hypothetical protein JWO82_2867 [Akkermansiaceae bacterium]|nr:hypothetical protein [Akkermansiaceae bacterium]